MISVRSSSPYRPQRVHYLSCTFVLAAQVGKRLHFEHQPRSGLTLHKAQILVDIRQHLTVVETDAANGIVCIIFPYPRP